MTFTDSNKRLVHNFQCTKQQSHTSEHVLSEEHISNNGLICADVTLWNDSTHTIHIAIGKLLKKSEMKNA